MYKLNAKNYGETSWDGKYGIERQRFKCCWDIVQLILSLAECLYMRTFTSHLQGVYVGLIYTVILDQLVGIQKMDCLCIFTYISPVILSHSLPVQ